MAKTLRKRLFVIGEINDEAYSKFTEELHEFEQLCYGKTTPGIVDLEISSEGGDATLALAFYDRILESSVCVKTTAFGLVASAASLIWIAGEERSMGSSAWIMVHEDSFSGLEGKITALEKDLLHARRLENQWAALFYGSAPTVSYQDWIKMHKEETYLNYQDCKNLGLLTE